MVTHSPADTAELAALVADTAAAGGKLELRGGGTKAAIGRPARATPILSLARLAGIVDYDAAELVLTAHAGTRLADIEALTAARGQFLAFDPYDHGPVFGQPAGDATIGGIVAAGVSGPRRVSAGAVRDHLLGFQAVSGRGEVFVGGAKVVKNVTGYDLPKVATGSWGQLMALTQVTLKVLPRPRSVVTVALRGLQPAAAQAAMAVAMRSHLGIAAAAHLPRGAGAASDGGPCTAFRMEGFGPSVTMRCAALQAVLRDQGTPEELEGAAGGALWDAVRLAAPLENETVLWRVHVPPSRGCDVVATLERHGARWLFDWAGGLVWLGFDGDPMMVRAAAASCGGEATLVRAPAAVRAAVPVRQPQSTPVAALSRRIRRAFDPAGVFDDDRFLDAPNVNVAFVESGRAD